MELLISTSSFHYVFALPNELCTLVSPGSLFEMQISGSHPNVLNEDQHFFFFWRGEEESEGRQLVMWDPEGEGLEDQHLKKIWG